MRSTLLQKKIKSSQKLEKKTLENESSEETDEDINNPLKKKPLPIEKYKKEIIKQISENIVVIISGKTGCGKTTQVPKYILEQNFNSKILVTQPRRIGAISIAKRMCQELHSKLGDLVGFHVRMNPNYNENSKIIIKTTGIFLEELIHNNNNLENYTHIIIDEVHVRDINIDFILVLMKVYLNKKMKEIDENEIDVDINDKNEKILNKNKKFPKLILMSATISSNLFANYFSLFEIKNLDLNEKTINFDRENFYEDEIWDDEEISLKKDYINNYKLNHKQIDIYNQSTPNLNTHLQPAKIINIDEKTFTTKLFYIDSIIGNIIDDYKKHKINLTTEEYEKISFLSQFQMDLYTPKLYREFFPMLTILIKSIVLGYVNNDKEENDSILVFLPGLGEILTIQKYLEESLKNIITKIQILNLHSEIEDDKQLLVFKRMKKRKLILSTNIAESSITISDIGYVIDFCLVKEIQFNPRTRHESLLTRWASKASLEQRAGRAGRVKKGYVFRFIKRYFFELLNDYPSPEILRISLDKTILKLKVSKCGEPDIILSKTIQPPFEKNKYKSIKHLQRNGALTTTDVDNRECKYYKSGDLTALGRIYAELPVDVVYCRLIMLFFAFGYCEVGIILGSILSQEKSIFKSGKENRRNFLKIKDKFCENQDCDIYALFNAFKIWFNKFGNNYISADIDLSIKINNIKTFQENNFCNQNFLRPRILHETLKTIIDLKNRLNKLGVYEIKNNYKKIDDIKNIKIFKYILAGSFYENFFYVKYKENFLKYKKEKDEEIEKRNKFDIDNYLEINFGTDPQEIYNCFYRTPEILSNSIKDFFSSNYRNVTDMKIEDCIHIKISFDREKLLFEDDFENYKRESLPLIREILFISSSFQKNIPIQIHYPKNSLSDTKKHKHFLKTITITKPTYNYELIKSDFLKKTLVECSEDSVNYVIVETDEIKVSYLKYVADDFHQKRTKYISKNACRLPLYPMIDSLLYIIFAPSVKFISNQTKTQYHGFLINNNITISFSHLFSGQDIKDINFIRKQLNFLVGANEKEVPNIENIRNSMIMKLEKVISRKRLKVFAKNNWTPLLYKYYPSSEEEFKSFLKYFNPNEENDKKKLFELQNDNNNIEHKYFRDEIIASDFLNPLQPLNIQEDSRLWIEDGLLKLEIERKNYEETRIKFFKEIENKLSYFSQEDPMLFCSLCGKEDGFLFSIKSVNYDNENDLYLITYYLPLPIFDKKKFKLCQEHQFIIEYRTYYKKDAENYLLCFKQKHIIGFMQNRKCYFTKFSSLIIKLFGYDEFTQFNHIYFLKDNYLAKKTIEDSKLKKAREINKYGVCEICKFYIENAIDEENKKIIEEENKKLNQRKGKFDRSEDMKINEEIEYNIKILELNKSTLNENLKKYTNKFIEHLKSPQHKLNVESFKEERFVENIDYEN